MDKSEHPTWGELCGMVNAKTGQQISEISKTLKGVRQLIQDCKDDPFAVIRVIDWISHIKADDE